MDITIVYDRNGTKYTLIHPPKKGGEGEVFRLSENSAICAKIYYRNVITEENQDKITSMIDNPPIGDLTEHKKKTSSASIAWPVSELYRSPGRKDFCGFLMPVIDTELFREAHMYYDPQDRKRYLGGSFTWKYLLTTAYNIAHTVSAIHKTGHCIGDMSGSNILVARTAAISIIDCDSFQIENKKTGRKFFTKVATGDYLAPELMGINFRTENIDRYYSDLFSLSILIFKFLMNGVHPFQARGKGVESHPTTEHKIKNGIFPYRKNVRQIYPPLYAPPYAILSPETRALFERCFVKGIDKPYMRPDADEWVKVLQDELSGLKQCDENPNHWHSGYLEICPWCEILKIKKKEYFPYKGPKIVKTKTKITTTTKNTTKTTPEDTTTTITKTPVNKPSSEEPETERRAYGIRSVPKNPHVYSGKKNTANNPPANTAYRPQNSAPVSQLNNPANNSSKSTTSTTNPKQNPAQKRDTKNNTGTSGTSGTSGTVTASGRVADIGTGVITGTAGTRQNSPPEKNSNKSTTNPKQNPAPERDTNTYHERNRKPDLKNTAVKQSDLKADGRFTLKNAKTETAKEKKEASKPIKPEIIPEKPKKIILKPEIRPDKINLSFDPDCDNKVEIEIINRNEDPIEITAKAIHRWILLPDDSFSVKDKKIIEITVDKSHFEEILPGVKYKSWIEFKTPAGNIKNEINVSLQKDPLLNITQEKRLLFRGIEKPETGTAKSYVQKNCLPEIKNQNNIQSIEIINSGERTLKGNISSDQIWITAKPDNFFTKTTEKVEIIIIPENMKDKAIQTGKINIKSNGGECEIQVIASLR